jgi:hypothetical protein
MNNMSYEDQLQEALKRSLGLEETKDQVMGEDKPVSFQEMTEDKKVVMNSESSNTESSDSSSNSSDSSDSEGFTPEQPE